MTDQTHARSWIVEHLMASSSTCPGDLLEEVMADLLSAIARSGVPCCCKRDSRVAVKEAVAQFNQLGEAVLEAQVTPPTCATVHANIACLGSSCPWHPGMRR